MNTYYLKIMKASDDIVLDHFEKSKQHLNHFPDDREFQRDFNFLLSVLLERGYSEQELLK